MAKNYTEDGNRRTGVFIIENLCDLGALLENGGTFMANTYPINYAEMTGLSCRVIAEI